MNALINSPTTRIAATAGLLVGVALFDGGATGEAVGLLAAAAGVAAVVAILAARPADDVLSRAGLLTAASLLGLAALTALSLQWASDHGAGFRDLVLALGYSSVFIVLLLSSRPGSGSRRLVAIAAAALVICTVSLLARLFDLGTWDATIGAALPAGDERLSGPLGYWNALGSLAALSIPILLWRADLAASFQLRRVAVAAIALPMVVIMLTASRGAVLAALLGVAVLIGYAADRRRVARLAAAAAAIGAVVCLLVAVVDKGGPGAEAGREAVAGSPVLPGASFDPGLLRGSDSGRSEFWGTALDAFGSDPIRGVGAGGFPAYWAGHGDLAVPLDNAHSAPLEALAELGILGGVLSFGFFVVVLRAGRRRARRDLGRDPSGTEPGLAATALAVVVAGSVGALFDWTYEIPGAFLPVLVAAALICGRALLPARPRRPQRRPQLTPQRLGRRPAPAGALIAALGASVAAVWAGAVLLASSHSLDQSRDALAEGRVSEAARFARAAIQIEPWAAEPRLLLAETEAGAGNLDAALRQGREAVRLAPEDFRAWRLVSLISAGLGDSDAADAYGAAAERLAPLILARSEPDPAAGQTP